MSLVRQLTLSSADSCFDSGCAGQVLECIAQACEAVPQNLAENAGIKSGIAAVCSLQDAISGGLLSAGIDGLTGEVCDMAQSDAVMEALDVKVHAIQSAMHAAINLLRVDCVVVAPRATQKLRPGNLNK